MDECKMNETIFKQNAMMLQHMVADNMFDGAFVQVSCDYNGLGKSEFAVGLEKNIWNSKRSLLQSEVSVVGVQGMGGLGKTTLSLALSKVWEVLAKQLYWLMGCKVWEVLAKQLWAWDAKTSHTLHPQQRTPHSGAEFSSNSKYFSPTPLQKHRQTYYLHPFNKMR
jgi:hypothetical protein